MIDRSVKIRNYKCFKNEEQGFEKILPINIIIGKNNSGKSSLIDLVAFLYEPRDKRSIENGECIIELVVDDSLIKNVSDHYIFSQSQGGASSNWDQVINNHVIKRGILNTKAKFVYSQNKSFKLLSDEKIYGQYLTSFISAFTNPFNNKQFKRITAERDIKIEGTNDTTIDVDKDGTGTTNLIRRIINDSQFDPDLVKNLLLENLNQIIKPDIQFSDIHPRHIGNGEWEIYFKDSSKGLIALSKMGSGIKTLLLILLNLIVIPEIKGIDKKNLVFGFEELENNLHPSLQRRLFNYINKYAEENNSYFFITTHSSIPIDLFISKNNAQIIHIENNGAYSTVKTVINNSDGVNILKDLDYKASDILLSNGVIWVEGPSDAIYIELLLDMYKKTIGADISKLSYTIQSLSTAIWKYAGFSGLNWEEIDTNIENQIISLASVNHNHLIIIDNDCNYDNKKPSEYNNFGNGIGKNKSRLINESMKFGKHDEAKLENNYGDAQDEKLFFWINDGTFETYFNFFITNKGKEFEKYFSFNEKRGYFEKTREGENSSKSKVELAAEIAKFTLNNKLTLEDFGTPESALNNKIRRLFNTIKSWN